MNTKLPPSGNSFQVGFYKVLNVYYPRATVSYKANWRDAAEEPRLIDFNVLFHPRSTGPKDLSPGTLVGKDLQIIDAGQIQSQRNFQLQFIDFAVWRVINRTHIAELDEQSAASKSNTTVSISRPMDLQRLNALPFNERLEIYNQMKADPENAQAFEVFDEGEFSDDTYDSVDDNPELQNDLNNGKDEESN
jgi:hypothetical protein